MPNEQSAFTHSVFTHLAITHSPYKRYIQMNLRQFALLTAASLLLPIGSAFAVDQTQRVGNLTDSGANVSTLLAQRSSENGGRRNGQGKGQWLQQLNLTPEQQQRIRAIREDAKANNEGLRQQMQQAREQMRSLSASNASDNELRQHHQQVQALQQQMSNQRFETLLKIRAELTPEQRAQMAQLMEQRKGQRGNRRARQGENGGRQRGNF